VNALFTTVHNGANGAAVYEGSVVGHYNLTKAFNAGVSYMDMKGNETVDNNHAHQVGANVDHALSRRTSVYVLGLYQHANSDAQAQINGLNRADGASSNETQAIARVWHPQPFLSRAFGEAGTRCS